MGQFCESCAPGYKREPAFGGKFASCVPCQCNNHSEQCDADSGKNIVFVQGSHRLDKYLNIQHCLEKSLKIQFALKST